MDHEAIAQGTSASVIVYGLRLLEYWSPWIAGWPARAKILLASLGAVGSAIGIHYTFSVEEGTLVVTGLTLAGLVHGLGHAAQQYAAQQILHDLTKSKGAPS